MIYEHDNGSKSFQKTTYERNIARLENRERENNKKPTKKKKLTRNGRHENEINGSFLKSVQEKYFRHQI